MEVADITSSIMITLATGLNQRYIFMGNDICACILTWCRKSHEERYLYRISSAHTSVGID